MAWGHLHYTVEVTHARTHTSEPHLFWECCWSRTESPSPVSLPPSSCLPFLLSFNPQETACPVRLQKNVSALAHLPTSWGSSLLVESCCRPSSIHLWRMIVLQVELCDSLPVSRQMYSRDCGWGKRGVGGGGDKGMMPETEWAEPGYITVWDHSPALIVWIKPSMNHSFSLALAFTCQPHDH